MEDYLMRVALEGGTPAEVPRALAIGCGDLRALSRSGGRRVLLNIPYAVSRRLGRCAGRRLNSLDPSGGSLLLTPAGLQDLPALALPVVRRRPARALLYFSGLPEAEVTAVPQDEAEFALLVYSDVIFLLYRFGAAIDWRDAPYFWRLAPRRRARAA